MASADAGVEKAAQDVRNGKFLDASASCATYSAVGVRRVAYLGPFKTLAEACEARVRAGDLTAVLHKMDADERGHSYCVCAAGAEPVLQAGAGTDGDVATLLTIADAQRMLKALGFFKPKIVGDPYGPRTIAAVQAFQIDQQLVASGIVDQSTWRALKRSKDGGGRPLC
jgi:ADP-ribose pyrophosphatase YjhB (NUDIX family)